MNTQSTRREFGQKIVLGAAGGTASVLALSAFSCPNGQSVATTTLQIIIPLAEGLLPFIPGLNGAEAALLTAALNGLSDATTIATTELASTDTPLEKFTKISAEFAKVALSSLSGQLSGAPLKALTIISNVANAVANFLATIKAAPAAARAGGYKAQLTAGDLKALPKIAKRAAALKAKLGH
jgi:hypothetical protein